MVTQPQCEQQASRRLAYDLVSFKAESEDRRHDKREERCDSTDRLQRPSQGKGLGQGASAKPDPEDV